MAAPEERALSAGAAAGCRGAAAREGVRATRRSARSVATTSARGLAHLLAVSGQNVLLLAHARARARAPSGPRPLRTARRHVRALVALYVPLAGAGPSIQRAGVMGAAGLAAALAGPAGVALVRAGPRRRRHPRAQPARCRRAGWQLSFAAVVGI